MRVLDLFCGEGGAARGYADAGFDVVGCDVDLRALKRYPFNWLQIDWRDALEKFGQSFDLIHASPPCQSYSKNLKHMATAQPMLIEPVREALAGLGVPYVIENVEGAPLIDPVWLCGTSFGLRIQWHRQFECSFPVPGLPCQHDGYAMNPFNVRGRARIHAEFGPGNPEVPWRREKGVEWMSRHGSRESIPPAYTRYIGERFLAAKRLDAAA